MYTIHVLLSCLLTNVLLLIIIIIISARVRQHICYSALYAITRPSVCPSVTRVDHSKTVEVRIMQPSPQSSPMTLVS